MDVSRYLDRIGFDSTPEVSLTCLEALQRAHLTAVPFENLDVYNATPVRTDLEWSIDKIVNRGRGGWCFEVNGAFAALLEALGFAVARLGAAVLLSGPTTVIDHLTLEVTLDKPYLVDVGFGESFIRPLEINTTGAQDGGSGTYELIRSANGVTLTEHDDAGVPKPLYRFSRLSRTLSDFDPASTLLQTDRSLDWSQKPFATRLIDGGPDRVTLLRDRLKTTRDGVTTEIPVSNTDWSAALQQNFSINLELVPGASAN